MRKSLGFGLTAAAVIGTVLTPAAGWAAVTSSPAHMPATTNAPARGDLATSTTPNAPVGGDPATTVTFTVTVGSLAMTAPPTADLGSGAPGTTISGPLGIVVVTDNRALLAAAWTATASSTAFTTGGGTPSETIPVGDATYSPGTPYTTGTITATPTNITLTGGAQTVVAGTAGVGNNTATWNPAIAVAVPAAAVGGLYTGTLTQSVS
jgi:hypothetical protein